MPGSLTTPGRPPRIEPGERSHTIYRAVHWIKIGRAHQYLFGSDSNEEVNLFVFPVYHELAAEKLDGLGDLVEWFYKNIGRIRSRRQVSPMKFLSSFVRRR